jgi:serine/threonine-protein kinase
VGTIHYVAPEQIEGTQVSPRSDVYSLGCLLFHCLTGQVPFARDTDVAVIYAHLSEEPPKLSTVRPELTGSLDGVIAKALDKSPDRRFPTCGDLINAARAVIDAAGPLADTSPPRTAREAGQENSIGLESASRAAVGSAIEDMRDVAAAARRPRVLLGGVDANTRAVTRLALGDRVDVVETRSGGSGVVERAREARPDLVILDYGGVGQPASAVVGSLRDDALTRDAKVLLLVDFAQAGDRDVTASGADERLAMPFSPLQLQVKLRKLLGPEAVGG